MTEEEGRVRRRRISRSNGAADHISRWGQGRQCHRRHRGIRGDRLRELRYNRLRLRLTRRAAEMATLARGRQPASIGGRRHVPASGRNARLRCRCSRLVTLLRRPAHGAQRHQDEQRKQEE